jgi:hypothetical protein
MMTIIAILRFLIESMIMSIINWQSINLNTNKNENTGKQIST